MKRDEYQNVTQEELDDDYTNDKNEIMQLMEERKRSSVINYHSLSISTIKFLKEQYGPIIMWFDS